jgi:hypothetical protein
VNWILIMVTFYDPNVKILITEIEFPTSEACLTTMAKYEKQFEDANDPKLNWSIRCEKK